MRAPRLRLQQLTGAWRARFLPDDWRALRWLLALHVVLQLTGIGWDLPCSFEWENDGVAPRDFFAGIALNLPPGHGHTYPLLHNLLLGLLNLPVLLVSALTAPAWTPDAILHHVLGYPTMTVVHLTAKLLSVLMGVAALAALARITARLFDRRAATWAVLLAMANLSFAYYGRTTNLDGPYLCWMALAADRLLDVVETGAWRDYRAFALLLAASIATKDQAYAAWLLPGPLLLIVWPLVRPNALAAGRDHWRLLGKGLLWGVLGLAALGGALWNPPGFLNRLHTLTGHASQDWRSYQATATGVLQNLRDLAIATPDEWWPLPVLLLVLAGLLVALRTATAMRFLPLLLAVSQIACFTLVVGRVGHRFALPTGFWLAAYAGVGASALIGRYGAVAREGIALLWLWALAHTLTVQVAQWTDARRPVEAWLAQLPAHTRILIAGPVVSQPRWGRAAVAQLDVTRLGPQAVDQRNPLLGVKELQGDLTDLPNTRPDAIVLPAPFVSEFVPHATRPGEQVQVVVQERRAAGGQTFFQDVAAGNVPGYRVLQVANQWPPFLDRIGLHVPHVHSSVGEAMVVLIRNDAHLPPLPEGVKP